MKVRDIMTSEGLATATLDTTLQEIANMMRDENVGAIPVLDEDDELAGIITDRDIVIRAIAEGQDPAECTAEEILSEELHTIESDTDIEEAADLMARHKIRRLPVVDDGVIVGMISLGDISVKGEEEHASEALEDISRGVKPATGRVEGRTGETGGRGGRTQGEVGNGRAAGGGGRNQNSEREGHGRTENRQSGNRSESRGTESGDREGNGRSERSSGDQGRRSGRDTRDTGEGNEGRGKRIEARGESGNRSEGRNPRNEGRGELQSGRESGGRSQGGANRGATGRTGSVDSVFSATSRKSSGEQVAEEETEYQRNDARRASPQGGTRAGKEQAGDRGRQSTSARGRDSGQARGEDARNQGITNRTSGEEKARQQKVTPMRAEASNPGRNRNKKRAS